MAGPCHGIPMHACIYIHPYAPHRPRVAVLSSRIILVIVDSMGDGWCIGRICCFGFSTFDQGCSLLILAHVPGSPAFGPPEVVCLFAEDVLPVNDRRGMVKAAWGSHFLPAVCTPRNTNWARGNQDPIIGAYCTVKWNAASLRVAQQMVIRTRLLPTWNS